MAGGTQVIGPSEFDLPHRRQHRLGPQATVHCLLTTRAGERALAPRRLLILQQPGQSGRAGLVHRRTQGFLDSFQIDTVVAAVGEKPLEETLYFPRDFLVDRLGRFFPWAV